MAGFHLKRSYSHKPLLSRVLLCCWMVKSLYFNTTKANAYIFFYYAKKKPQFFVVFSFSYKKHKLRTLVDFTGVGLLFLEQIFYVFLQEVIVLHR